MDSSQSTVYDCEILWTCSTPVSDLSMDLIKSLLTTLVGPMLSVSSRITFLEDSFAHEQQSIHIRFCHFRSKSIIDLRLTHHLTYFPVVSVYMQDPK
jgi:chemotaxis protein CheY-P-specific phosphatase CheC